MLGADVVVIKAIRFFAGQREDLLGPRRKIIHCFDGSEFDLFVRLFCHLTNIRFGEDFQTLPDNFGAQVIPLFRVQLLLRALLQMCGLGIHEQFINRQAPIFRKCAQIDSQFHDRKQVQRFLRSHRMSIGKHAVGPTDLVPQAYSISFESKPDARRVLFR